MIVVMAQSKFAKIIDIVPITSLFEGAETLDEQIFAALLKLLVDADRARGVKC